MSKKLKGTVIYSTNTKVFVNSPLGSFPLSSGTEQAFRIPDAKALTGQEVLVSIPLNTRWMVNTNGQIPQFQHKAIAYVDQTITDRCGNPFIEKIELIQD